MQNRIGCFLAVICLLGACPAAFAVDDSGPAAKELLRKAKAITAMTSFSSVTPIYHNGQLQKSVKLYRKAAGNGKMLERVENIWSDSLKEGYVSNTSGTYVFRGESVMKVSFLLRSRSVIYTGPDDLFGSPSEYSMTEEVYQGIPCCKVTVKIPRDPEFQEKVKSRYARFIQTYPDYLRKRFPFEKHYLIDKEREFIYSYSSYNFDREKIFSCDWGKVDFQIPADDALFETPQGNIVVISKEDKETEKYLQSLFAINFVWGEPKPGKTEEAKLPDARDILFGAMRNSRKISFRANLRVNKGGKFQKTILVYHWPQPDGKTLERVEHAWSDSWKEVFVINGNSRFSILDKTPVKTEFSQGGRRFIYESVRYDLLEEAEYSMTNGKYNGNPCYQITVKIPTDEEYVKARVARKRLQQSKSEEELLKTLPFVKIYLVDKQRNFIYSCTSFSLLGRKITEAEWGDVVFDPPMDEALFEIPEGKNFLAKTPKEFMRIREQCIERFKLERRARSKR